MTMIFLLEGENSDSADEHGPFIKIYMYFLLMFHCLFRLSDNGLNVLLVFFSLFFSSLSKIVANFPKAFLSNLPRNVKSARMLAGSTRSTLRKFVCCSTCHSLYKCEECIMTNPGGDVV